VLFVIGGTALYFPVIRHLKIKRARQMFATLDELVRKKATMQEVRDKLGEPRNTIVLKPEGEIVWFYDANQVFGLVKEAVGLSFDPATRRVRGLNTRN